MKKILLKNTDNPKSADIDVYLNAGGYRGLTKAIELEPADIIEEVSTSGLKGRGGAGFPTAMKWRFASSDPKFPKYLICNADEGEPGTFKDRPILEKNPHLLIEGMIISGIALGSEQGYIYLRGEYPEAKEILENSIRQAHDNNYLGNDILGKGKTFDISVYQGAGAYICGEETALIESIEGKRGQPRSKPPFPVNQGAWDMPTIVNNVETLSNIPYIVEIGGEKFAGIGSEECPGPKLFCVSGSVNSPGVYELPMGISLKEIIYDYAGGIKNNAALKAVIPGGLSTPVLPANSIDCKMDFISMQEAGSMLGSGAVIVMDESVCMVKVAYRAMKFFEHESCGKCVPCREGTDWLRKVLERIENGKGRDEDIDLLMYVSGTMTGRTFCPLGDGAAGVVKAMIHHFRNEFEDHIREKKCTLTQH
jgi:NADH-quinone oxidoreductase subunit F